MTDTDVDIAVRWNEAGQDIPAKTAAGLRSIRDEAGAAAPAVGDRMARAFARMEAREPTMVLRRSTLALETMAASAIGAEGPLGRLGGSFLLLGAGSGPGLVALGGLAAVAAAIHFAGAEARETDARITKLGESLASPFSRLTPEFARVQATRQALGTELSNSNQHIRELQASIDSGTLNFKEQSIAERELIDAHKERQKIEREMAQTTAILGGGGPESHVREATAAFHQLAEAYAMATTKLALYREGFTNLHSPHAVAVLERVSALWAGLTPKEADAAAKLAGSTAALEQRLHAMELASIDRARRKDSALELDMPFGKQASDSKAVVEHSIRRDALTEERNSEKLAAALGRELGPLIAMATGGGARGAVSALSGVAGTLGSLNDPHGHPLLGAASPYLSLASGVLSGLTSLFGGGGQKPKVIITAFEEEAARQIKELRSDPATTSIIIVGSTDIRSTQQALARLSRTGAISRLPR